MTHVPDATDTRGPLGRARAYVGPSPAHLGRSLARLTDTAVLVPRLAFNAVRYGMLPSGHATISTFVREGAADLHWKAIAIDLAVGDSTLLPEGASIDGVSLHRVQSTGSGEWFLADRPGVCRATHPSGWSAFVRVRRKLFVGLGSIRHLDDPDVE